MKHDDKQIYKNLLENVKKYNILLSIKTYLKLKIIPNGYNNVTQNKN